MSGRGKITRRDFLNGVAMGTATGALLSPMDLLAKSIRPEKASKNSYPPELMGMRGNHVGSFEVAHDLAWQGMKWPRPSAQTDDIYDLVVVGAGISGLAAAWLYRSQGGGGKILLLDNHDDFGGHAKRNEFTVDGQKIIGYGGSQSIDTPSSFSAVSKKLLKDLAIDVESFYGYFDRDFSSHNHLQKGIYFREQVFGVNKVVPNPISNIYSSPASGSVVDLVEAFPIPQVDKNTLVQLLQNSEDLLPNLNAEEKIIELRKITYMDFLEKYAGVSAGARDILRDIPKGLWGVGWDALSALEAVRFAMPGTEGLGLEPEMVGGDQHDEPYIFHFPDGNASVARALVRKLIPSALAGENMEDLVSGQMNYQVLDQEASPVRIRLNATAVDVRHNSDETSADVTYVKSGVAHRVRGKHVILACYNHIIPYICPELPPNQKQAMSYATKVPLVYMSVALRNWRAFADLGFDSFYVPKSPMMHSWGLDFPVSMGDYHFSSTPDQPIMVHGAYIPAQPNEGLIAREQHKLGRHKIYGLNFEDFENDIITQMNGALAGGGFEAERDIAGITVNRWPHGYAYEYNDYSDPADWGPNKGPHIISRAPIGRISIANSDSSAYAYVNGAIDAAARAVDEQLKIG